MTCHRLIVFWVYGVIVLLRSPSALSPTCVRNVTNSDCFSSRCPWGACFAPKRTSPLSPLLYPARPVLPRSQDSRSSVPGDAAQRSATDADTLPEHYKVDADDGPRTLTSCLYRCVSVCHYHCTLHVHSSVSALLVLLTGG